MDDDIELSLFGEGKKVAVDDIHSVGSWYVSRNELIDGACRRTISCGYLRIGLAWTIAVGESLGHGTFSSGAIVIFILLIFFTNPICSLLLAE